jgi:hypothetical protein
VVSRREAVGSACNLGQWSVYSVDVLMPCIVSLSCRDLVGPLCSRESFTCPAKQAVLIARHDLVLESDKTGLVPPRSHRGLGGELQGMGEHRAAPWPTPVS